MSRPYLYRLLPVICVAVAFAARQDAAETRKLTLTEAVHLAIDQNRALKIARPKISESEHKKAGDRSLYFPSVTNQSNALHITNIENIAIPAGAFGAVNGIPVPNQEARLPQGATNLVSVGTMVAQPLTQLIRIHQANIIAAAEVA